MASDNGRVKSVIVIGGGLGGLALAQALRNRGIQATVFERDESKLSRAQGYMIGLDDNGCRSLLTLSSDLETMRSLLNEQRQRGFQMLDRNLDPLLRFEFNGALSMSCVVNRIQLRHALTENLNVQWNKRFKGYVEHPDCVEALFEDGTSAKADILVGADGAHSRVRSQLCPQVIYEDTGVANVGGWLLAPPDSATPKLSKYMHDFMMRTMCDNSHTVLSFYFKNFEGQKSLVWSISHLKEFSEPYPDAEDLNALKEFTLRKAESLHPEIAEMVRLTPAENFMAPRSVYSTRPESLNSIVPKSAARQDRVVLLGDAAHAMTTHRGLGANTAFQDAVDLAKALHLPNWRTAVFDYQKTMVARGKKAVADSLQSTKTIHMAPGWGVSVRNGVMWTIGSAISLKQRLFG
eukprot:TRINITY_DN3490_c0_g1_i1.p1 TRINITY_DN3490_c0_g1~~TRINITY_DN3490_c0_g1_i1.p1  ORF type:complete len:406 (+),score=123.93 TRINITY_DN3490_c0_g1_i1:203-1420(+)